MALFVWNPWKWEHKRMAAINNDPRSANALSITMIRRSFKRQERRARLFCLKDSNSTWSLMQYVGSATANKYCTGVLFVDKASQPLTFTWATNVTGSKVLTKRMTLALVLNKEITRFAEKEQSEMWSKANHSAERKWPDASEEKKNPRFSSEALLISAGFCSKKKSYR